MMRRHDQSEGRASRRRSPNRPFLVLAETLDRRSQSTTNLIAVLRSSYEGLILKLALRLPRSSAPLDTKHRHVKGFTESQNLVHGVQRLAGALKADQFHAVH